MEAHYGSTIRVRSIEILFTPDRYGYSGLDTFNVCGRGEHRET